MGRTKHLCTAAAILAAGISSTAEAAPLSPVTRWHSETDGTRCRVSRVFGEERNHHLVIFDKFSPDKKATMTVAGPSLDSFATNRPTPIAVSASGSATTVDGLSVAVPWFKHGVVLTDVTLEGFAHTGSAASGQIATGDTDLTLAREGREVRFQTGPMDEPLAMLDTCTQTLAASWGLDPDKLRAAPHTPQWLNRETLLRDVEAGFGRTLERRKPPRGVAHLRVIIDETGAVEDCAVAFATTTARSSERACRAMRKARFQPARDAEGTPLRSYFAAAFLDYRQGFPYVAEPANPDTVGVNF
jgi:TonB family protein